MGFVRTLLAAIFCITLLVEIFLTVYLSGWLGLGIAYAFLTLWGYTFAALYFLAHAVYYSQIFRFDKLPC